MHFVTYFWGDFWGLELRQISNFLGLHLGELTALFQTLYMVGREACCPPPQAPHPCPRPFRPRASAFGLKLHPPPNDLHPLMLIPGLNPGHTSLHMCYSSVYQVQVTRYHVLFVYRQELHRKTRLWPATSAYWSRHVLRWLSFSVVIATRCSCCSSRCMRRVKQRWRSIAAPSRSRLTRPIYL